jgi:ketosteroid isomerase-like protein
MQNPRITRWLAASLIWFLPCAALCQASGAKGLDGGFNPDNEKAIKTTIGAYRAAWLAGDSKGVLKTFTDDAVLQPARGALAVVGIAAIEKYWFTPGGPPTTITELNITFDQVGGNRGLAFARGLNSVAWTVTEDGATRRHSHSGTYLDVMKKLPDGSWRIQVHMWDEGPERVD